jgi:aryl-alcohol dehydrogenase-like predicted oxidoreductase
VNSTGASINKISLGTVKLGIPDYGFSSSNEKSKFNALEFLKQAEDLGITRYDTSPRYGQSEKILGEYIKKSKFVPFISSKIDGLKPNNPQSPKEMVNSVQASLKNLNKEFLDICYLHQNDMEIISDPYVHEGFQYLKSLNLIRKSGSSLYNQNECEYCIESKQFDFIQVPINVFDLSFYNNYIKNKKTHVCFVARSLLLQGVLINRSEIEAKILQSSDVLEYLNKFDEITNNFGVSSLELGLAFVFSLSGIDQFIIGTNSIKNLIKDIHCLDIKLPEPVYESVLKIEPKKSWVNPRNWG